MSDTRKSPKVVEGPVVIDGGVSRAVETPDGGARLETWNPEARSWFRGGANWGEMMFSSPAPADRMDALGIPESDRG